MLAPDLVRMEAEIEAEIAAGDEVADREKLLRHAMDQTRSQDSDPLDGLDDDGFDDVEEEEEKEEEGESSIFIAPFSNFTISIVFQH